MLAVTSSAATALADDPASSIFSLNGFGTFGLTRSSERNADFSSSTFRPNGAGFTRARSASVDSLVGAQVTANFTPRLSGILQIISEQNYDNSYRPHVEWANIKYEFTPNFSARVGRSVLPVFLVSDFRKVGYANPWVRPPIEVYSLVPVSSSDGVSASYRMKAGEITHTFEGSFGGTEAKLPGGGVVRAKGGWTAAYGAEYGAATVRASYSQTTLTITSLNPLFDGFRRFGAQGIAIANRYDPEGKTFSFIGLGGTYDPGGWFVTSEWGFTDARSVLGKRSAWYVSGGYRIGKLTPYATYARARAESNTSDPGLSLASLPAGPASAAAGLNAGLNAILGSAPVQNTVSAGLRWDVAKNAAFKLQFDHTRMGAGSPGLLINVQPGFRTGGKVNVLSATIDFVF